MFIYNKTKQIAILLLNVKRFPPNCVKKDYREKNPNTGANYKPKNRSSFPYPSHDRSIKFYTCEKNNQDLISYGH